MRTWRKPPKKDNRKPIGPRSSYNHGMTQALSRPLENAFRRGTPFVTRLPAPLQTWDALLKAYGKCTGHLVCYRRLTLTPEQKRRKEQGEVVEEWELYQDPTYSNRKNKWSLNEWDEWHTKACKLPPEQVSLLLYLVDVELPDTVQEELQDLNPFLKTFDDTGPLCLNYYIVAKDKSISRPHMRSKLYVAPVIIPGAAVLTPPHLDGLGTQTSVHTVVCGSGFNLVDIWKLKQEHEVPFREIVGLPPRDKPQHLPHDVPYRYDTSTTHFHTQKDNDLLRIGIKSYKHKLEPGFSVILRAGNPHSFKKCMNDPHVALGIPPSNGSSDPPSPSGSFPPPSPVAGGNSSSDPPQRKCIPLAGFAGDVSYIGDDPAIALTELGKIVAGHKLLRANKQNVYCFWQLALWCMISVFGTRNDKTEAVMLHMRTAAVYVNQMLQEEEEIMPIVLKYLKTSSVLSSHSFGDEYVCSDCRVCLWNMIFAVPQAVVEEESSSKKRKKAGNRETKVNSERGSMKPDPGVARDESQEEEEDIDLRNMKFFCGRCAVVMSPELSIFRLIFRFNHTPVLREFFDELRLWGPNNRRLDEELDNE